jgi:transient receptor potential cation channel subfamily A protein 1
MFYKVLNSFFFFLLWYSLFIVAFGLGFYIMLHDDSPSDVHGLDKGDKNQYFNRTWLSLVKTSAMFVGELEFSDLPINSSSSLGMLAYAFFLTFIFLIVVVLMNLLNGLAVSDTNDIKDKAEIYSYISRVETISYMESILLGDPFDFLSNVPTYLSSLPSGSLLRSLYRNACCRKVCIEYPIRLLEYQLSCFVLRPCSVRIIPHTRPQFPPRVPLGPQS